MPPTSHLVRMYLAENRKTFSRGSGWAALAVAAAVPILAFLATLVVTRSSDAAINGQSLQQVVKIEGATAYSWALWARNFYLLPLVVLWATGSSFAAELKDHTLRELVVRPVSREVILLVKVASLWTLSLSTLVVTALVGAALGLTLHGFEGEWGALSFGYLASALSDLGLILLGAAASLFFRSEAGVVVGVILFLLADLVTRLVLKGLGLIGWTLGPDIALWMPGSALAAWEGALKEWTWQPFAGLGVLIVLVAAVVLVRFRRMDVP